MPNDDQMNYSGEQHYYGQGPQPAGHITQNFEAGPQGKLRPDEPQMNYPGEQHYYSQTPPTVELAPGSGPQQNLRNQPPKRNGWKVATLVLLITTVVFFATTVLAYNHGTNSTAQVATPTAGVTQVGQHSTPAPTTQPSAGATSTIPASATGTPTTSVTSPDYSAAQPGPGCDTGGGTWTPQGLSNIACGTQLTSASKGTPAYLYFQLPNNEAFSAKNEISIKGGSLINGNFDGYDCLGLAEQDANTGFLVEYCGNGDWSINSISSVGAVVKTLSQGLTSERQSEQLSLTLNGTTLSFSIDTETHAVNISSIQPAKIAIMVSQGSIITIPIQNFSYTTLSS